MAIFRVGAFLVGNFLWWKFPGWKLSDGNHPGGNFPGRSFHVTKFTTSKLTGISEMCCYFAVIRFFFFTIHFFGPASARSYKIGIVGNNWLGSVFSETALSIFLIFCMKLGDYRGRKDTEPHF